MFRREKGFNSDNKDWFWVKYALDGTVMKNPKAMSLAGRVAKGMEKGCIACHAGALGNDKVFNHDNYRKRFPSIGGSPPCHGRHFFYK